MARVTSVGSDDVIEFIDGASAPYTSPGQRHEITLANFLTSLGLGEGGGYTESEIKEFARDAVGLMVASGNGLTWSYNDTDDILTISFTGDAGDIPFTPVGSIAATDVQAAIAEVASDAASALSSGLAGKSDTGHTHVVTVTVPYTHVVTFPGEAVAATSSPGIPFKRAVVITNVWAYAKTAPTGAAMRIDVNKNGTTIFTTQANRPNIAAGTNVDMTATPDVTAFAADDVLTVDIDIVGSSVAGADVVVGVEYTESVS